MYNICIGYDRDNRMPAYTMADSIMEHSSIPINFMFLHKHTIPMFTRANSIHDSTEFSNSRFLVPYLFQYIGWTLFVDNDMIVETDIKELFDYKDEQYAVQCVMHNQICKSDTKFLGKNQHQYNYKNWSSVMLFNNAKCKALTLDYVNTAPGMDLHQFNWLTDKKLIGELPLEWNYLVDNENQTENTPKLIHYTNGGPFFEEHKTCKYSENWISTYNRINDVRSKIT